MAAMTETERTYWIQRIHQLCSDFEHRLIARRPKLPSTLDRKARANTFEQLGLTCEYQCVEQLGKRVAEVREAYKRSLVELCRKLNIHADQYTEQQAQQAIEASISVVAAEQRRQILERDPEGQMLLRLLQQKTLFTDLLYSQKDSSEIEAFWRHMQELVTLYESYPESDLSPREGEPIQ